MRDVEATLPQVSESAIRWARADTLLPVEQLASSLPTLGVTVPTRTSVAAGVPSSKVTYSMLSSPEGEHSNRQKETLRADASFTSKRCPRVVRSHLVEFKQSPTKIPYKAVACATMQSLTGAFLMITGCLLLAGYISKVGSRRAIALLIVGFLVFLPGLYHLLIACKAGPGCQGYSYQDLPDCDD